MAELAAKTLIKNKTRASMVITISDGARATLLATAPEKFLLRKFGNSLYIWQNNSRLNVSCFSSCHGVSWSDSSISDVHQKANEKT